MHPTGRLHFHMSTPPDFRDRAAPYVSKPAALAWRRLAWMFAVGLIAQSVSAATLTFTTNADYDNNFYEVSNAADLGTSASGYLNKVNTSATSTVYNTHATGGSGGLGGTTAGTPLDKFGDVTLQASFSAGVLESSSTSVGFFTKINDAATTGYLAVVRLTSATTADFRLFDTASLSSVGTQIGSTQTFTTAGSFATNTFYIFKLAVTDVGLNVQFDASLWTTGGSQIGSTITATDTTSAVTGLGQVGLRLGSSGTSGSNIHFDDFSVTAIPEPGTYALFASVSVLFVAGLLRRKRTQR